MLSAEANLLLKALDPLGPALLEAARNPDLDWDRALWLAEREKATLALWDAVRALPAGSIPAERLHRLHRLAVVSEFRMLRLEGHLRQVLSVLGEAGIEVVLLKGAALATSVYGSFRDRPMYDLDLLVRPEQADRAWDLLRQAGWIHDAVECPTEFYNGHHHLAPLDDPAGTGLSIEIHTAPWRGAVELAADTVWMEARRVEVGGQVAWVPRSEHLLLHLASHFAWGHLLRSSAWRTLRDLRQLIAHGAVDWDEVVRIARESKGQTCCFWALRLARGVGGAPVPERVLRDLQPPRPAVILGMLERHYLSGLFALAPARCPSTALERALWTAGIAPRWSGHGTTRPWERDRIFLDLTTDQKPLRPVDRLRAHLGRAAAWVQYLRFLLGSSRYPAPPGTSG